MTLTTEAQALEAADKITQGYEGLGGLQSDGKYYPYQGKADKQGVLTIGRGHVLRNAEKQKTHPFWKGLTLAEVEALYLNDMKPRIIRCKVALGKFTPNQLAGALAMFFNYEAAWTPGHTPYDKHHAGDFVAAAEGMLLYIVSKGKKQLGLWRRRMSEALCYLTGEVMIAKDAKSEAALFARLKKEIPHLTKPAGI